MSQQWPDMFFGRVIGGAHSRRPVPAKHFSPEPSMDSQGSVAVLDAPIVPQHPAPAPTAPPKVAPRPATTPAASTSSQQWPAMFFGQPVSGHASTPQPPAGVPTAVTARVPLSQLPPGAQPHYLQSPSSPPRPAKGAWPNMFFGESDSKTESAPAPTTAPSLQPISAVPPVIPTAPVSPTIPSRPAPAPAPEPIRATADNPLADFLTPMAQLPTGVSRISLPTKPQSERASTIPAPEPTPAPAPAAPRPASIPSVEVAPTRQASPPAFIPEEVAAGVVLPPAFSREEPPPSAPVYTRQETVVPGAATSVEREFLLNNGERISGRVVSETPEAIYLHSESLGVLTLPRYQLAQKLREVILINGDRIIGDVIAETADTLYLRNASLGTLTIPKAQSSFRVIEVILKNGDRVVGELITENDDLLLLKSATLGTLSVSRKNLDVVNRRLEHHPLKPLAAE